MSQASRKIFQEALALPDAERVELIVCLLDSLEPPGPQARSDEEWIAEVERRAYAALSGSPGVSWEDARSQIAERLPK